MTTLSTEPLTLVSVRRAHGLATLTLSTGETLRMPRALLRERPYRGGTPFDRAAFDALLRERAYPFALQRAVSLLAARPYTRQQLADALARCAYPDAAITRVLARMTEAGYLDDDDFAERWAQSRTARGIGAQRIRAELRQKGVDAQTIARAVQTIDEQDTQDSALKAARKAASGKTLSDARDRQRIFAALARRGFSYDDARRAVDALRQEQA